MVKPQNEIIHTLEVQTFDIETVDALRQQACKALVPVEPIAPVEPLKLPPSPPLSAITAEITVKKRVTMVYIPFSEPLELLATYRVKSWKDRFTLHRRRFYLYKRPKDEKFYWDVRDMGDTRTSCLFGPFDTNEDAYENLSQHYGFRQDRKNEMERMD